VNEEELRLLFDRTISWISKAAQSSGSLAVAIRMLDELRNSNFAPLSMAKANKNTRPLTKPSKGSKALKCQSPDRIMDEDPLYSPVQPRHDRQQQQCHQHHLTHGL
jgi:hypothetical protein